MKALVADWTVAGPVASALLLGAALLLPRHPLLTLAGIAALMTVVVAAVHHAEVVLVLAFAVSTITLGTGRTHIMQGAVHLVIFAAFLFLTLVP